MGNTYLSAYIFNITLVALLFLFWIFASQAVNGLVRRKSLKSLKFGILLSLGLITIIGILNLAKLFIVSQLAANGLELIPVTTLLGQLFLLAPLVLTLILSGPLLLGLLRRASSNVLDEKTRIDLAAPALVVPVQLGVVSSFVAIIVSLAAFSLLLALLGLAVVIAYGAWRWWQQTNYHHRLKEKGTASIPRFKRRLAGTAATMTVFLVGLAGLFELNLSTSRLPDRYAMAMASAHMVMAPGQKMLSVTDLTGPKNGVPDKRITLTAQKAQVKLSSGQTVEALTFNGQLPGPEIRVRQGDLVEVTLVNKDITQGVTAHWHGVDVPNAEDGVAGLTQDAVMPGQTYVYRFVAADTGTYWYHSHQQSAEEVKQGLFGAFIVDPATPLVAHTTDLTILTHSWKTTTGSTRAIGIETATSRKAATPGNEVRLRLINSDNTPQAFTLTGAPFQVAAIDGTDLNEPGDLNQTRLLVASGGRYDLRFTMPNQPVLLDNNGLRLLISPDGKGELSPAPTLTDFNPAVYGKSKSEQINLQSRFDREYTFDLDNGLGFYKGSFATLWPINGQVFPNTPSIMVKEGDLIKITFVNRSPMDHPMHPHGHKMLVLSRNGQAVSGSPWRTDTLNVAPGEIISVALKADNPGLWMDHCHNLDHAAAGMVMHLMYENVMSSFEVGPATPNNPE